MNEHELRSKVASTARKYLGCNEADGSHKRIIDLYNSHRPLARGYKVKCQANGDDKNDAWCATYVSAIAIECGLTDIMPTECSCPKMVALYKAMGCFVESDAYVPKVGDILMYDWSDNGAGDNKGDPDHVGIVVVVVGDMMTIIEGNYDDSVKYRHMKLDSRFIRGYCVPNYSQKTKPVADATVLEFQQAAIKDGFSFPRYGSDGEWGQECEAVAKKAIVKKRLFYTNKELTKLVQRVVGVTADGKCGAATKAAIITYQQSKGLMADGEVGINTWKKILGVV